MWRVQEELALKRQVDRACVRVFIYLLVWGTVSVVGGVVVVVVASAAAFGWWWVWQCASSTLVLGGLRAPSTAALVAMFLDGI